MISLTVVKTKLEETGYTIAFAKDREIDLQTLTELPIIYVGYNNIENKHAAQGIALDIYAMQGENLTQSFTLQIACLVTDFDTVWKKIYKTLVGWNPNINEQLHTSFTYTQGAAVGLSNSKFYWVDIWRIGFPTNSLL